MRDVREDKALVAKAEAEREQARKQSRVQELYASAVPILRSHGDAYFRARDIILAPEQEILLDVFTTLFIDAGEPSL